MKKRIHRRRPAAARGVLRSFFRNNALSLAFSSLFLFTFVGQVAAGFEAANEQHVARHLGALSFRQFLGTGDFLDGMFANWQAAVLQLACLILLAAKLRQKGAAHSRNADAHHKKNARRRYSWLYRNSLSLSLLALFVLSFIGHVFAATRAFNQQAALTGEHTTAVLPYLFSASFWFKTLQTWQAEFIALVFYLVLSIFTRQQDSAESKHLGASNAATGETNK